MLVPRKASHITVILYHAVFWHSFQIFAVPFRGFFLLLSSRMDKYLEKSGNLRLLQSTNQRKH